MIGNILALIDTLVLSFTSSTFGALAAEFGSLIMVLGSIGLLILIINMMLQLVPMHGGVIFAWAVKFVLVSAAASSWTFFQPIYEALNGLAEGVAGVLLGGDNIAAGLDNTADQFWDFYDELASQAGLRNVLAGLLAVVVGGIAVALAVVAIGVIGISKIGLGVAIALAPIFITALLFKATSDLFASWTKWTLSFVLNLILTAGVIGIMGRLLEEATRDSDGATTLEEMAGTIVITVAMIFFIKQVPSYSSALAGTVAVGGISLTSAAGGAARGAMGAARGAANAASNAYTGAKVANSVMGAGKEAKAQGGSMMDRGLAMAREYNDIQNKARTASRNARLRGAAAANTNARKERT